MDTIQLTLVLRKDKHTRGVFQGVYPSDKLPKSVSSFPALFMANVDTSEKPGSHWVAFYFTKDCEGEFFYSYGLPPSNYTGTFTRFLKNNSSSWTFNSVTLQSMNSKVCGHYCLYYAVFRRSLASPRIKSSITTRFLMEGSIIDSKSPGTPSTK